MGDIEFNDQVAVITGAGGGLGRAYAIELARRGAHVVVNDLGSAPDGTGGSKSTADAVVDEIRAFGGQAVADYSSVADAQGGQDLIDIAVGAFGTVDIVINNAGILRDRSFAKLPLADLEAVLDVHLRGAFHVSQPAFHIMKNNGYGRFLFTSSAAGLFGNFGQSNYAAAKMGLVGLANVLAIEGAKSGINSNVIAPIAATRLTRDVLRGATSAFDPAFVAPLACYLVSRECEFSREIFSVGGGRYASIFVGLTQGWLGGKDKMPTVEDVRDHMIEIRDESGYQVPGNAVEEITAVLERLR